MKWSIDTQGTRGSMVMARVLLGEHPVGVVFLNAAEQAAFGRLLADGTDRDRLAAELAASRLALADETRRREGMAAELEAVRGSGGVLTREECVAMVGPASAAAEHVEAGARAQHARDVAVVREALGGASIMVRDDVLSALTSDAAPSMTPKPAEECNRDEAECNAVRRDLVAARAEVERLKAAAIPTPPADLDGYERIYQITLLRVGRWRDGIAAVLAARDAWWEERLVSEAAVKAGQAAWMHEPTTEAGSVGWLRAALRAAIAAVKASAAPAPAQPASVDLAATLDRDRGTLLAERTIALSTALGAPPGESWDALLGRVRGMVEAPAVALVHMSEHSDTATEALCGGPWVKHTPQPAYDKTTCVACLQRLAEMQWQEWKKQHAQWNEIDAILAESESKRGRNFGQRTLVERVKALAEYGSEEPAPAPTLHLTAEDREKLGRAARDVYFGRVDTVTWDCLSPASRSQWSDCAAHVFALAVEAALAAVQSEDAAEAANDESEPLWALAARRVVKVPAKEEPTKPSPDCPHLRCEAGSSRCLDCGARPPGGRWPEPAPLPPLPEVPEDVRQAAECGGTWGMYIVALDAALRARGGR